MSKSTPTHGPPPSGPALPFLKRVKIRNYKSLADCDVELGPLTVLVGRNGSGKSNFLDALSFVADALRTSPGHALKSRGGINEIRHRGAGHDDDVAFELELGLPDGGEADYGFGISSGTDNRGLVKWEQFDSRAEYARCHLYRGMNDELRLCVRYGPDFEPVEGVLKRSLTSLDRLLLASVALFGIGLFTPMFNDAYDELVSMKFYNFNPASMRSFQGSGPPEVLQHDGGNIAGVVGRLDSERPDAKERLRGYLATIVPGVTNFGRVSLGPMETLEFEQGGDGAQPPWKFYLNSMSDGTLRALGALVAVAQLADGTNPVRLVGVEEPETALHPGASGALMDALREATVHKQVVVTTHSADFLDQIEPDSDTDRLLVVQSRGGVTEIGRIDPASREAVVEHLYSPGELLRMDQFKADPADVLRQRQSRLPADVGEPG